MQSFQRNKDSPNAMVVDEDEDKEYDEEEMDGNPDDDPVVDGDIL